MLGSADDLKNQLLTLKPSDSPIEAATNFINVVAAFFDKVQAGPTGSPGIFTYNKAVAIPLIAALPPVPDQSWIMPFANAINAGAVAGTLTPGTVTLPAVWLVSVVDVLPPVITTIAVAKNLLIAALTPVTSTNNPPLPLAQALYLYISAFIFLVTGIGGTVISPVPIPVPIPAQ